MVLSPLSKKSRLVLIFLLIVNPVREAKSELYAESKAEDYHWKDRGCIAVFNGIYNSNAEIDMSKLVHYISTANLAGQRQSDSTFNGAVKFVQANPDKIAAVAGFVLSSCLLYHSIQLTRDISLFYQKFKELRREFDAFVDSKLPKIERLVAEIQSKIETGSVVDDKEQQHIMFVLGRFYEEVHYVLGKVRRLIEEANQTQRKSNFVAGISFLVAAAAFALYPVASTADLVYRIGVGATGCLGTTAGVLSLMNAHHWKLALNEMRKYEGKLEGLSKMVLDVHKHLESHIWWSDFYFWVSLPDVQI